MELFLSSFLLLITYFFVEVSTLKIINNGLAAPEIVHTPIQIKTRCVVKAAPLDLVFILDSSGSLKNKFQDEIDVIRRIVSHVTIGETATRVALVQYSGIQRLEFGFLKFTDRQDILQVLEVLRHVSGITKTGAAFEFTIQQMTPENGLRERSVPKIAFLLSDGRTHDYPKDKELSEELRRRVPGIDILAYGTGDYVAIEELANITKDYNKIVTNHNLTKLEPLFDRWRGSEVCEPAPVCVKGSDKPLDLLIIIDTSESVEKHFGEQITFAIERIIHNINVNPDAVRLALITYSGQARVAFNFNNQKFLNNSAVIRYLNTIRPMKGTTATHLALNEAAELFINRNGNSGVRSNVKRVAIILTDGHSQRSPRAMASRLAAEKVDVFAVSMTPRPNVDEVELLTIARDDNRVFTPSNLQQFETEFLKYIGFGCLGMQLGPNATPRVRGATDVICGPNSVTLTVRTQQPLRGLMYSQLFHDDSRCVQIASGQNRQTSITLFDGTCGLVRSPSINRDGYHYNVTIMMQFHPLIITRVDQGLDIHCFYASRVPQAEIGRSILKKVGDTQCSYRLHRYNPDQCVALDAKVGESLYHKWECNSPPNYQYLVHDCRVQSETQSIAFLDADGCEIDPYILETPVYSRLLAVPRHGDRYVWQQMSVFKFPGEGNVRFQCKISLCDMESNAECTKMIPPRCSSSNRERRSLQAAKRGFDVTLDVETRRINVLENERIKPPVPVKYCDIRL